MYEWRKVTPEARVKLLADRQSLNRSWHRPSQKDIGEWFHLTAACFEHKHLIGLAPARMKKFAEDLLFCVSENSLEVSAWCLLPNHYHVLLRALDKKRVSIPVGRLHGRTSHTWNVEEDRSGRKCFHGALFKKIRSSEHRWSTLNYIHHNPVKHGYVEKWEDWPYSSAHEYLQAVGKPAARKLWRDFPVLDMGKGWDDD